MRPLLLLALLLPLAVHARQADPTGTIAGDVTHAATGAPIPGVNVTLEGTTTGAATDAAGAFRIGSLRPGSYVVVATAIGFRTERVRVTVRGGETVAVPVALAERAVDIGEVVVLARETLTGGGARVRDLPGSAHYVGVEELRAHADTDPMRVLRTIPGVNVQEEDGYGLRPNIGLRGVGTERTQRVTVMEDGVLAAPAPYAAPAAYYFPTVGRMHGVEVRKGASQVKYGPFTTAGALNLISTPIPSEFAGYAEGFVGQNEARNLHVHVGDSYRNVGFLLETYQSNVAGFKEIFPLQDLDTGFDKGDYLAKVRLNTSPGARVYQAVELKLGRNDEVSRETYLGLTAGDFARSPYRRYAGSQVDRMDVAQRQVALRHVAVFPGRVDLTTTVYRNTFSRNWYKLQSVRAPGAPRSRGLGDVLSRPDEFAAELALLRGEVTPENGLGDGSLAVRANNRVYRSEGVQTVAGVGFDLGPTTSTLELGLRLHRDEMDRLQWEDQYAMTPAGQMNRVSAGLPGTQDNRINSAEALAAFAQAEVAAGRVTLTPGLRFERITLREENFGTSDPGRTGAPALQENTVNVLIPGVAARVALTPAVDVFGGVHRGFAPPSSRDSVRAESSLNVEAGVRYGSPVVAGQLVAYFNDYANLLGSDLAAGGGAGTTERFNGGAAHVYGLEASASADLASALGLGGFRVPARLAYTYTDATFRSQFASTFGPWGTVEVGDEIPYVARHQAAASLGVEWARYGADLRAAYTGARRDRAGQGPIPEGQRLDAHLVLDLSASADVDGRTTVFGGVRNVLDAVYVAAQRPAGLRPGLPRTVILGVRTRI